MPLIAAMNRILYKTTNFSLEVITARGNELTLSLRIYSDTCTVSSKTNGLQYLTVHFLMLQIFKAFQISLGRLKCVVRMTPKLFIKSVTQLYIDFTPNWGNLSQDTNIGHSFHNFNHTLFEKVFGYWVYHTGSPSYKLCSANLRGHRRQFPTSVFFLFVSTDHASAVVVKSGICPRSIS